MYWEGRALSDSSLNQCVLFSVMRSLMMSRSSFGRMFRVIYMMSQFSIPGLLSVVSVVRWSQHLITLEATLEYKWLEKLNSSWSFLSPGKISFLFFAEIITFLNSGVCKCSANDKTYCSHTASDKPVTHLWEKLLAFLAQVASWNWDVNRGHNKKYILLYSLVLRLKWSRQHL